MQTATSTKLAQLLDHPDSPLTWTKCFAVPGTDTIIDMCHPITQRSQIRNLTLEEIQSDRPEYATAAIVNFDDFCAAKAARQDAGGEWIETTETKYHDMLNVLPPAAWTPGYSYFMVGEAYDHHASTGQPRFSAFRQSGNKFFKFSRPMTFREFKQIAGETARYCYC